MEDDLTFGASVWAASEPITLEQPAPKRASFVASSSFDDNGFDEFDDFGPTANSTNDELKDDEDFGDFGDFGEPDADSSTFVEATSFYPTPPIAGPSTGWQSLRLDPLPSRNKLQDEVDDLLGPLWDYEDIDSATTDEGIREVEGMSQILFTQSSREMYRSLLQSLPPTKPPNWTRSRIRRQHLISLGIPVNLDEVLPRANGRPLPMLEVHTRPMSAPPGPRAAPNTNGSTASLNSRSTTPQASAKGAIAQFGPKPDLDVTRINKLLQLSTESMTMQPLPNLERHLSDMRQQIANTSELLTYLLRTRDALQQDSETYNGLIAEMVGEAQKMKSGKPTRTASYSRRGTNIS